jgi:hydroxyacylglutathione hydrolase
MIFEQIKVGYDNFAYLIADEKSGYAALIDPAFEPEKILIKAEKGSFEIKYLINTHSHYDHTNGNDYILKNTNAVLLGFNKKIPAVSIKDNEERELGKLKLTFIHTPGHTPDSICILTENIIVSGDTLFVGTIGKTGFGNDARLMYQSIQKKILPLKDSIEVYPGHDYGPSISSTIGNEKKNNPFLKVNSFDSFLKLKKQRSGK